MSHDHAHESASRVRLAWAFAITASVLVAELVGALLTGSLALLVDAGHMLTDAGGLLLALLASHAMARPPDARRTWGYGRLEALAAGVQASVLLAVGLYALIEGAQRLADPPRVEAGPVLVVGLIGLAANLASAVVLYGSRSHNLNLRAAFLEVVTDALGSVAVVVGAVVIAVTGWAGADAAAGMLISVLILPRAVVILRHAGSELLESVPEGLDLDAVRTHIGALDHVREVHDLHASRIGTQLPVLTAHVVLDDSCFREGHTHEVLDALQECVREHFAVSVEHSTFQLEPVSHATCEPTRHA